ncbi:MULTISPECIES: aminotransferase class V-fold PLP-dependent enzyme [unclassified Leptolyngbya]|uniref:aminotransferase class V-fold PLP-dependent enzyme n=1 Tax=unclassified Leptolyngbya TaxID=2650499 RepID=UPI0016852F95|nr:MULTISPECIES: aminotransferase class V-fold PLP-dependent enzyme [unclassified Leptolyngbya]MBD1909170.1 aminotransferase class V-fold PLP-dependent enzyme [Leptolyngbya sp. FACHB-8]MBD2158449.1 aminotransferase class V-fold PLP-dependent enzyme [Leptolyngbya sp. FACHB-16]
MKKIASNHLLNDVSQYSKHWLLDPEIVYLNHGSFGACPIPVLNLQTEIRQRLEAEPVKFFAHDLEGLLDNAVSELASFVGTLPDNLTFVPNATAGVNTVLRSIKFQAGDELLLTNHEYNACRNVADFIASQSGVNLIVADIPFPLESSDQIIQPILEKISKKTRLVLMDHVTSQTGLIFPVQQLVAELSQRGIDSLIDGAHAPGLLPLKLDEIKPTYYTGNCHKWMCAPKGAAFLYIAPDRQTIMRPLSISHGANSPRTDRSRFRLEFDWLGTHDPTAYLCVPEAIKFMGSLLPGGWAELMQKNHSLALKVREMLCRFLEIPVPTPDTLIGSMASIPLPSKLADTYAFNEKTISLQEILFREFHIEVPIMDWPEPSQKLLRISAQIYNSFEHYERLADALKVLISRSRLL